MKYFVVIKYSLDKTFSHWAAVLDAHTEAPEGVELVFRYPVVGEQAVLLGIKTDSPRDLHDMMYDVEAREEIEASGVIFGREQVIVTEIVP